MSSSEKRDLKKVEDRLEDYLQMRSQRLADLRASIDAGIRSAEAGKVYDVTEVIAELKKRQS